MTFFLLFMIFCYISDITNAGQRTSSRVARIDEDCLEKKQLSLVGQNDKLRSCQRGQKVEQQETEEEETNDKPKALTAYCEEMQVQKSCFAHIIEDIYDCLSKDAKTYYKFLRSTFEAAYKFDCETHTNAYKDQITKDAEKCKKQVENQLDMCETTTTPLSRWPELQDLKQPVVGAFSPRDCRKKGLWVYCALDALDDCKATSVKNYYKGHYSAILNEGPCRSVIANEFPILTTKKKSAASDGKINELWILMIILITLQYQLNLLY